MRGAQRLRLLQNADGRHVEAVEARGNEATRKAWIEAAFSASSKKLFARSLVAFAMR
jgi:hypothetical protein